jgi:hypothetical protein
MTLDTATTLAELIDGQIKFLWTAIGVIAVAQIAILRAALNAAGARWGAKIWAGVCAVSIAMSYLAGYAAASGLVTLVMEAGAAEAAATDAIRIELEADIKTTLSTVEVFIGGQVVALIVAVAATAISFLMNRDLLGEMIDGGGDGGG